MKLNTIKGEIVFEGVLMTTKTNKQKKKQYSHSLPIGKAVAKTLAVRVFLSFTITIIESCHSPLAYLDQLFLDMLIPS